MKRFRNILVLTMIIVGLIALFLHNRQTNEISTFKWVGTVHYDTLSEFGWRQWDQMKKQIPRQCRNAEGNRSWPWYPRRAVNYSWEGVHTYSLNDHVSGFSDYEEISVKISGYWRDFFVTTNPQGRLVVELNDNRGLASKQLEELFASEVYKSPFRLRRIYINYNGFNPESFTSTADVTCIVIQNR